MVQSLPIDPGPIVAAASGSHTSRSIERVPPGQGSRSRRHQIWPALSSPLMTTCNFAPNSGLQRRDRNVRFVLPGEVPSPQVSKRPCSLPSVSTGFPARGLRVVRFEDTVAKLPLCMTPLTDCHAGEVGDFGGAEEITRGSVDCVDCAHEAPGVLRLVRK